MMNKTHTKNRCAYLLSALLTTLSVHAQTGSHTITTPYSFSGVNKLSKTEVNAITFSAPIKQINYPAGQLSKNGNGKPTLTYTANHKTIIFLLNKKLKPGSAIQFMVSLANEKLFSLHFAAAKTAGKIIDVIANKNIKSSDTIENRYIALTTQLEKLMRRVLVWGNPGVAWQPTRSDSPLPPFHSAIHQHIVAAWKKASYELYEWKICSQRNTPLIISLTKNDGLTKASTFLSFQTLKKAQLNPGSCAYLLVLHDRKVGLRKLPTLNVLSPYRPLLGVNREQS